MVKRLMLVFIVVFGLMFVSAQGELGISIDEQPTEGIIVSVSPGGGGSSGRDSVDDVAEEEEPLVDGEVPSYFADLIFDRIVYVDTVTGVVKLETVNVLNGYGRGTNVRVLVERLADILSVSELAFDLRAKEAKDITLRVDAPAYPGFFLGRILINAQDLFVFIDVSTNRNLLFVDLIMDERIAIGEILNVSTVLREIGDTDIDKVVLEHSVLDFDGEVFLSENRTVSVDGETVSSRRVLTNRLLAGEYILVAKAFYDEEVFVTSHYFEIREEEFPFKLTFNFLWVLLILLAIRMVYKMFKDDKKKKC